MTSDRPIFVVGCPRSGTTHAVADDPRAPAAGDAAGDPVPAPGPGGRGHDFGDLSHPRAARRPWPSPACATARKVADLGLNPKAVREQILDGPPTIGSAFGIVFREFAELHGKARWGDKRPLYFQEVDVLLRLFPDAQIVHIVRDGRANVASLKRMPWWPYDSIGSMATWSQAEYCARRDRRRLPADAFHVMRYESLVADPRRSCGELCDFLDEDFDEAMLEPQRGRDTSCPSARSGTRASSRASTPPRSSRGARASSRGSSA